MYATETEMEHFYKDKSEEDSFDVSAKNLFILVDKLRRVFRAANLRVDARYELEVPHQGVSCVIWSGSRGDFMLELDGPVPRQSALSDLAGDKPWIMEVVARYSKEIYDSALEEKHKKASSMSSSVAFGAEALKSILEEK